MTQVTEILKNHINTSNLRPSTNGIYERYLQSYIAPFFGSMLCDQLSNGVMQDFTDKLIDNKLSSSTAKGVISFLKKGLAGHYPPGVFDVGIKSNSSKEISILKASEQRALENAARFSDDTNRISVYMCLYTGIRIGELCGLMWCDVDFSRRDLFVRRTIQRIKNTDAKIEAKTKVTFMELVEYANRRIPLPNFLFDMLCEHKASSPVKYVITTEGNYVEPRTLQYRLKKLTEQADIKQANFQTLRHTFAVRALESNFDVMALSKILGHASPFVTYSRYATLINEDSLVRKSMENLAVVMQK